MKAFLQQNNKLQMFLDSNEKVLSTWWGDAWKKHLKEHFDIGDLLSKGKSLYKKGKVSNICIQQGEVTATVQGRKDGTYNVTLEILELPEDIYRKIQHICQENIASIKQLLEGSFSQEVGKLFQNTSVGVFPQRKDIMARCSCSGSSDMCTHVYATLHSIGKKLDSNPKLFFTLRCIDTSKLISNITKEKRETLKKASKEKSSRVLDDTNISSLFGIDMP